MTMQREVDFLLIGGGQASAAAAATLRLEGAGGSILILSAEEIPPYRRPQLSKQFLLRGGDGHELYVHPESFYHEHGIELALGVRVTAVDPKERRATTSGGEQIRYGQVLIATGARPEKLAVPGTDLRGIHYLRRKADCEAIRRGVAAGARTAVVVGGSFLGMEISMSLVAMGLKVSIVEIGERALLHLEAPAISKYFEDHAQEKGASIFLSDSVAALHGNGDGHVREVETKSGRNIRCDLVVISVGVAPETDFLDGSGIAMEDGLIVVDEQLRTSAPGVFAAGDVTRFYDPVFARHRHIEHWDNAKKQGRLAARNMLGRRLRYDDLSYFYCDVGDISFSLLGAPEEGDEQIARGSLQSRSFAAFYLKDGVVRALFSVGRPLEETRQVEALIRYRSNIAVVRDRLNEPDFPLAEIPAQTVLILQGGGALGASECGVVRALEEDQVFPDIVGGVSIGALNGVIIASNPRRATKALEAFWSDLAVTSPFPLPGESGRAFTSMRILMFGVPSFFKPRWLPPFSNLLTPPANWLSFYDPTPMRKLICNYVDFSALKRSPVRLLVAAVNVVTAKLEVFDSYVDDLTPDHVLASGSLPPGFPWTVIDGKAYWDGGIISNSPLDIVVDRCGPDGKQVFIVDLFAEQRELPRNMVEVMARRDEIVYAERVRRDLRFRETLGAHRELMRWVLNQLEPTAQAKIRQLPLYIEVMGDGAPMGITRFVRPGLPGESSSRDYDFSDASIRFNQAEGYRLVKETLRSNRSTPV
jgi:NADPH-dependent 2,4-dienoyl-CoA reductase/sulfur reductase-like enzyme